MKRTSKILASAAAAALLGSTAYQASAALIYQGDPPGGLNGTLINTGPDAAGTPATHYDDGNGGNSNLGQGVDTGLAVPTNFTMAAWVNLDSASGDNMVFGTTSGAPMHLGFRNNDAYFGFWGNDSNASGGAPVGTWAYMTWTYDSSTGTQAIYENGVNISSSGGHGPYTNGGTITIATTGNNGGDLAGSLDDARIYNTAFDAAGVAALYTDASSPDTPEPASIGLLGVGALGLLARRRRA